MEWGWKLWITSWYYSESNFDLIGVTNLKSSPDAVRAFPFQVLLRYKPGSWKNAMSCLKNSLSVAGTSQIFGIPAWVLTGPCLQVFKQKLWAMAEGLTTVRGCLYPHPKLCCVFLASTVIKEKYRSDISFFLFFQVRYFIGHIVRFSSIFQLHNIRWADGKRRDERKMTNHTLLENNSDQL